MNSSVHARVSSLYEKANDWLDQPPKSRLMRGVLRFEARHPIAFYLLLCTTLAAGDVTYEIGKQVVSARSEQQRIATQREDAKRKMTLPKDVIEESERMLAAYQSAAPVKFTPSETKFDLETRIGDYRMFVTRRDDRSCVHIQSTKTKDGNILGGYEVATILMTDRDQKLQSASIYLSKAYENSPEWGGEGIVRFTMRRPERGPGLVIDHYTMPGYGFDELYKQLAFPPAYERLVQMALRDAAPVRPKPEPPKQQPRTLDPRTRMI